MTSDIQDEARRGADILPFRRPDAPKRETEPGVPAPSSAPDDDLPPDDDGPSAA